MRHGLREWTIVTAVLLAAATAASLRYGPEIRAAFGVLPPRPGAAAAARGPAPLAPSR